MSIELNNPIISKYLSRNMYTIQRFVLIWLDEIFDENDVDTNIYHRSIKELRPFVNEIYTFKDADLCIDSLTDIKDKKVFMILSYSFSKWIISLVHEIPQLDSIYIFCQNDQPLDYLYWTNKLPKVKGIFKEINPILELLKQTSRESDPNYTSISFALHNDLSNIGLNQLDKSFMYTKLLKEIILDTEYDIQSIKEFTTYCRQKYPNDQTAMIIIDKFEQEYFNYPSVWWYTYPSFISPMLNQALTVLETDTIIKMGFFIRDLHHHITYFHSQQVISKRIQSFTVYRGQGMSKLDFEKILNTKGGLISFNSFLSTTNDYQLAYARADSHRRHPYIIGVIFQMVIDTSILSNPFAFLNQLSYFGDAEQEILFSMHTIFRILDVKQINEIDRFWEVQLILTSDHDKQLEALTEKMRKEIQGRKPWERLCKMWIKLGEFDRAEQVYRQQIDVLADQEEKAHIYYQLGYIMMNKGQYQKALSLYQKSIHIYKQIRPSNDLLFKNSYNNIGIVYEKMGKFTKALSFYEKALRIAQENLPSDHSDLAINYESIAGLFNDKGDHSQAVSYYEKALAIHEKTLLPNDPTLANTYNNIALTCNDIGDYSKAFLFYQKALAIQESILPQHHPDLAISYFNIGTLFNDIEDYLNALPFYEKALNIDEKKLPLDHPDLAEAYQNIANVYVKLGRYLEAIEFYRKRLTILEKISLVNHPELAMTYYQMGLLYMEICEYPLTLSFFEKTREIVEKVPSINPNFLRTLYKNMSKTHKELGDQAKASLFEDRAATISPSS